MEISISSDYFKGTGNPEQYLKKISEAGFTHIMWCHEWYTDYIYPESEINKIMKWLKQYNLKVLDLHASEGKENHWNSKNESSRIIGIELVKNRIYMANKLSCKVIILHFKHEPINEYEKQEYWDILHKSLNELKPYAEKHNVKIALENSSIGNYKELKRLFSEYDSNFLGLCYDSGHGNISNGINILRELKHRLISIHLHDNDGEADQHKLLFSGTVDWNELAKILVESSYKKCLNLETSMRHYKLSDETEFLSKAYETGIEFSKLVKTYSNNT